MLDRNDLRPYFAQKHDGSMTQQYSRHDIELLFADFDRFFEHLRRAAPNPLLVMHVLQYVCELLKASISKNVLTHPDDYNRFISYIESDTKECAGFYTGK